MADQASAPTVPEVVQSEQTDEPTVPVRVEGPVRVQQLPAAHGSHFAVTFDDATTAVKVLGRNPLRKRVLLAAKTGDVWVGTGKAATEKNDAFLLISTSPPIEITHMDELWARPDSNAAAVLSVVLELWTD